MQSVLLISSTEPSDHIYYWVYLLWALPLAVLFFCWWLVQFIVIFARGMLVTRAIGRTRRFYYSFINKLALYRKTRWTATLVLLFSYF